MPELVRESEGLRRWGFLLKMRTGSGLAKGMWRAAQVARVLARGLS
jgi:hypothetical protein